MSSTKTKLITFYLPQYHRIPENDEWWGEGFTEWTNVKKAKPLFKGHAQPHVPHADIGYYDLSDVRTSIKQTELAKQYGIYGFCYYYYWFNGKKLLDKPLNNVLQSKAIDMPFCICWANENWTRTWGGDEKHVLMPQDHLPEHDQQFIEDVIPILKDKRYIRINNKPVLVIYRTSLFPDIRRTARVWRQTARKHGLDLYLVRIEGLEAAVNPADIGFDAAIEFAPDWREAVVPDGDNRDVGRELIKQQYGIDRTKPIIRDYELTMYRTINSPDRPYKYFRGAFPAWDNTARKEDRGTAFVGSSPDRFRFFLEKQIAYTLANQQLTDQEKFVFINAWNEWGEGCHLEPDEQSGYANLEAVKTALTATATPTVAAERALNDRYVNRYLREAMGNNSLRIHLKAVEQEFEAAKTEFNKQLHEITDSKAWKMVEKYRKATEWTRPEKGSEPSDKA